MFVLLVGNFMPWPKRSVLPGTGDEKMGRMTHLYFIA